MSKNLHYNYFLPIFLWKFDTPKKTYYHFTDKKGNFWDDLDLEKKEEEKMKQSWKLYKIFYQDQFFLGFLKRMLVYFTKKIKNFLYF